MPTCILLCRTPCRSISRTSSRAISPTGRSSTDPAGCAGRRDGIISIPDPEAGDFSCPGSRRREDAPDCCPGIPGAGCSLWLVRDCAGGFPGRGAGGCPGRRRVYLPVAGLAGRCPGGSGFCPHPAALIIVDKKIRRVAPDIRPFRKLSLHLRATKIHVHYVFYQ